MQQGWHEPPHLHVWLVGLMVVSSVSNGLWWPYPYGLLLAAPKAFVLCWLSSMPEPFLARLISWLKCLHCNLAFPFRDSHFDRSEPPYRKSNTVLSCLISRVFLHVTLANTCVSAKFRSTVSPAARLRYKGVYLHHIYSSLWVSLLLNQEKRLSRRPSFSKESLL